MSCPLGSFSLRSVVSLQWKEQDRDFHIQTIDLANQFYLIVEILLSTVCQFAFIVETMNRTVLSNDVDVYNSLCATVLHV